jgi:hypothetical protein
LKAGVNGPESGSRSFSDFDFHEGKKNGQAHKETEGTDFKIRRADAEGSTDEDRRPVAVPAKPEGPPGRTNPEPGEQFEKIRLAPAGRDR